MLLPVEPKRVLAYPRGTETTKIRVAVLHAESGTDRPLLHDGKAARNTHGLFRCQGARACPARHRERTSKLELSIYLAPRWQASARHDRELSGHEPSSGSW